MKKAAKMITIFTVICGLVTFISMIFSFLLPSYLSYKFSKDLRNAGSIGIIGGADGPTSIYVSGQSSSHSFTIIFALLTILGIIGSTVIKFKKNRN